MGEQKWDTVLISCTVCDKYLAWYDDSDKHKSSIKFSKSKIYALCVCCAGRLSITCVLVVTVGVNIIFMSVAKPEWNSFMLFFWGVWGENGCIFLSCVFFKLWVRVVVYF
jgi:hypothetical protein